MELFEEKEKQPQSFKLFHFYVSFWNKIALQ